MDISSSDIPAMVFGRVSSDDLGEFSLDGHMLSVLMELDGKKSLSEISKKTGLNMGVIRVTVSRLLELKLIERLEEAVSLLGSDFLDYLDKQLSLAVGPIARILIEDAALDLGHSLSKFPNYQAAELVDILAREIQKEDKRVQFQRVMVEKIKEIQP